MSHIRRQFGGSVPVDHRFEPARWHCDHRSWCGMGSVRPGPDRISSCDSRDRDCIRILDPTGPTRGVDGAPVLPYVLARCAPCRFLVGDRILSFLHVGRVRGLLAETLPACAWEHEIPDLDLENAERTASMDSFAGTAGALYGECDYAVLADLAAWD